MRITENIVRKASRSLRAFGISNKCAVAMMIIPTRLAFMTLSVRLRPSSMPAPGETADEKLSRPRSA
jgi:hypothetical protein